MRSICSLAAVAAMMSGSSCGDHAHTRAKAPGPAPISAADCATEVAEIEASLLAQDLGWSPMDEAMELVTAEWGSSPPTKAAPVVVINRAGRAEVNGLATSSGELVETLQEIRDSDATDPWALAEAGYDSRFAYVAIAPGARWHDVVPIAMDVYAAGFTSLGILFGRPAAAPPASAIDDEFPPPGSPAASVVEDITDLGIRVAAGCPQAPHQFAIAARAAEQLDKPAAIRAWLNEVQRCGCPGDMPSHHAYLWRLLIHPNPVGVIRLSLDPAAPVLRAPATQSWAETGPSLFTGDTTAWLVVE
jgi:hypothetical protein